MIQLSCNCKHVTLLTNGINTNNLAEAAVVVFSSTFTDSIQSKLQMSADSEQYIVLKCLSNLNYIKSYLFDCEVLYLLNAEYRPSGSFLGSILLDMFISDKSS